MLRDVTANFAQDFVRSKYSLSYSPPVETDYFESHTLEGQTLDWVLDLGV